jgi:DNA replication protein DnaC
MTMNDDVDQLLRNLNLNKIREIYDEQLRVAEEQDLSYNAFLVSLLRPQWYDRQERSLAWRIKRANLPELWSLETFPFDLQPGVSRRQINALADLGFFARTENLIFIGDTGVGKTGLATGILLKAINNGYRCRFVRAQDLFDEMYASLADRSSRKLVNYLAKIDILLIDELGYLNVKPEQANIFYRLMEERYRRRSTIITTNLDYEEWQHFLGNKPMVNALLGRLRQFCQTIRIEGPSLRQPSSDRKTEE